MRRLLFLYLALACFVGLVAIFIVDGYLGIYDTIYITAREYEQKIEPDVWLRQDTTWSTGANWGEKVFFRYEVDNRQFSTYTTTIQASVWKANEKVMDLLAEDKVLEPFDKATVEWTLDSEELETQGLDVGDYTVRIEREGAERKIRVGFDYPPPIPEKVPVPPR